METIYLIRASICKFIKRFDLPIKAVIKFGAYFLLFHYVSSIEGFPATGLLNSMPVHAVLAVVSLLLPNRCGILLAVALGLVNISQVTILGAAVAAVFFLVVYIMTARLFPDHVYLLALVPLCMHFKMYLLLPLIGGLYLGIISLIPMICGAIMSVLLTLIPEFMKLRMSDSLDEIPQILSDIFKYGFNQVLHNEELIFLIIIFTGVIILIYLLRKMEINYGSYIALGAGTILGIVCLFMGKMTFGITDTYVALAGRSVLALLLVGLAEFMHTALNYQATQKLSFEDDEYQYYVTVIPKIAVGRPKREVKTITENSRESATAEVQEETRITRPVHPPKPDSPTIKIGYPKMEKVKETETERAEMDMEKPRDFWEEKPDRNKVREKPQRREKAPEPVEETRKPDPVKKETPNTASPIAGDGPLESFFEDE